MRLCCTCKHDQQSFFECCIALGWNSGVGFRIHCAAVFIMSFLHWLRDSAPELAQDATQAAARAHQVLLRCTVQRPLAEVKTILPERHGLPDLKHLRCAGSASYTANHWHLLCCFSRAAPQVPS